MADIFARLQIRQGTLAEWTSANPILSAGEPGYENDTKVFRIGDGSTPFLSLERFTTSDGFASTYQPLDENLSAFSALVFAANKLAYGTGIGSFAMTDLTEEARAFLALATKAQQRASLELTPAAITPVSASNVLTVEPASLPTRAAVAGAILATGGPARKITISASTSFLKATYGAYPDDHMVLIEAWGGGGGGASGTLGRGGGGGGYASQWFRYVDLPTSIPVSIGSGGPLGSAGGNTTIGILMTAFGGGGGSLDQAGGGGGDRAAGSTGGAGLLGGGGPGEDAKMPWGGGGGGINGSNPGGASHFGGGGGGAIGGPGGVSKYGGNGGAAGAAGVAPGGGGGSNAAGARGEVRIWL